MKNNNQPIVIDDLLNIWSNMSLQICHKYKLKKQIAIITLLFYQYCYLEELSDEQRRQRLIYTSYYEDNIHLNVAIVSGRSGRRSLSIKRFLFKQEIYDKIFEIYGNIRTVVINEKMLDVFAKIYQEEKNRKYIK